MNDIRLERCKRTDPRYVAIRNRHYVPNNGACGRQLHYIIWYREEIVGVISGGSSAFGVKPRDKFFGLDLCKSFDESFEDECGELPSLRNEMLGTIINNNIFRLEIHEDNLATRILACWRRQVVNDWRERYDEWVLGFETYVVENEHRIGTCYRADNWKLVGRTAGHKMIYCKKNDQFSDIWRGECLLPCAVAELLQEMYKAGR